MSPTAKPRPEAPPLEQLRDLYERIPFVQGRARVALLQRLRRVSHQVRQGRLPKTATPTARLVSTVGS